MMHSNTVSHVHECKGNMSIAFSNLPFSAIMIEALSSQSCYSTKARLIVKCFHQNNIAIDEGKWGTKVKLNFYPQSAQFSVVNRSHPPHLSAFSVSWGICFKIHVFPWLVQLTYVLWNQHNFVFGMTYCNMSSYLAVISFLFHPFIGKCLNSYVGKW